MSRRPVPELTDDLRPTSPEDWRDLLRREAPPDEFADLPFRARRRAQRRWRTARRQSRAAWIGEQRRRTPTPLTVPLLALVLALSVAGYSWFHAHRGHSAAARPSATVTAAPVGVPPGLPSVATSPSASPSSQPTVDPQSVARSFIVAYTTRYPGQDVTHVAAVQRAAAYASPALCDNLVRHDDRDFDALVERRATAAVPTNVTIAAPTAAQRPAADTPLRVWLQATATIQVTGDAPTTYTRVLTLEVSRSDAGAEWMVTRVLGIAD